MKLVAKNVSQEILLIVFQEDITAAVAGNLKMQIKELLAADTLKWLIINMGKVNYMDSAGLTVLVSALKTVRERGGSVKLYGLQPRAKAVLDITRLFQVFELYDSEALAIASCEALTAPLT